MFIEINDYSAVDHRREEVKALKLVRQIQDVNNIGRIRADFTIYPASGITSFHSYLLITK